MPNLYELMDGYDALQAAVEDDDLSEEDLSALLDAMESNRDELKVKVDNICRLIRNVDGEIAKFKGEEKRLAALRKARENKKERVRRWLKESMDLLAVDKMKTNIFEVSMVDQGSRVIVVDESLLPEEFVRVKREPDMTKLNKAYKDDGEIVAGCEIVSQKALRIR